ncbi:MAG TPA: DEAD/DEAH box helicase family protein [Bellilinea sp.]|nr:DEAD/DEAH box helicase family protein [Bellilinea sp.]
MKLKFKIQAYQTEAVEAVVDCFAGQPNVSGINYRIDPGDENLLLDLPGFRNADLQLNDAQLLENIKQVQRRQNLPVSDRLVTSADCNVNLDVEMETGTGKTYCYIKTIFELNKRYGWTKFIVVVPSIAIREGVYKSFEITADHFSETYGKKARYFIYNSKQLHNLESFSSDSGINVMIINIQAFNATGKDNRRIYEELDSFQSRRPIDVISNNRPILILDEPQKMEGRRTLEALEKFKPLAILRYSATHRTTHNKIYRLDALDAYNQKLVKKIAVRGISIKGLAGTNAYLYLEGIEISTSAPVARIEMEVRLRGGNIKRITKRLGRGRDLFVESNELDQYRGFVIAQIDANSDTVEFTNGVVLTAGEATGDITEMALRRIQIREAIRAHLDKERQLFAQGIKVLSLFFIDEVAKYRDYAQPDEKGEYARIFEEEYAREVDAVLNATDPEDENYRRYLRGITVQSTHNGYFAIDKKTNRLKDPTYRTTGENAGLSDDVDAYDLILKAKERLLSFSEPTRFIFSHSALREGWDNPNVFVMCTLKHSESTISRRQEVGRGLRLAVNQDGDRADHPVTVHDINVLTVVASESYKDFVANLQREISESLSERPRKADKDYFIGKVITTDSGPLVLTERMATQVYRYLIQNNYTDDDDQITKEYHEARASQTVAALPPELEPYSDQIFTLIDSVFSEAQLPEVTDGRKPKTNPLNDNFKKKEFQELWERINRKAVYRVAFDSRELIANSIRALDSQLHVAPLQYTIEAGTQSEQITDSDLERGEGFRLERSTVETHTASIHSKVQYDLIGKLAQATYLTRATITDILCGVQTETFEKFRQNPEHFISESARIINEQKASMIIEGLCYDEINERHDVSIFTASQSKQDFSKASPKLQKHIYDYVIADSNIERAFASELDTSSDVVVYAKLPRGFLIPTPVGDYNPDWAISFREGAVKYIYFVAETKGSMSTLELREIESKKIECARKFFDELNSKITTDKVKYDVVTDYGRLMELVGAASPTAP